MCKDMLLFNHYSYYNVGKLHLILNGTKRFTKVTKIKESVVKFECDILCWKTNNFNMQYSNIMLDNITPIKD